MSWGGGGRLEIMSTHNLLSIGGESIWGRGMLGGAHQLGTYALRHLLVGEDWPRRGSDSTKKRLTFVLLGNES